jgi:5-methylcytosine-specific restriction protein A
MTEAAVPVKVQMSPLQWRAFLFVPGSNDPGHFRGDHFPDLLMPRSAPRPCSSVGCRSLGVADGRCAEHAREPWRKKPAATKRISGRRLQALRAELFARNPLCVECERAGLVTLATQRDHIVPLAEGGADDDTNTQGLCDAHHEAKSLAEALRARRRAGRAS